MERLVRALYVGSFSFVLGGAFAQKAPPLAYGPIPSARQLKWQQMEMYCIVHFGADTYTDKEWGFGDEDPAIFNPTHFDAGQIVRAAKEGGFKGIIVVAKHHDGLCLWPSATTTHTIARSPYKNGKADLVREYEQACRKQGMQLGIYCSPWDRNNPQYGRPEYVNIYRRQLRELYTRYGKIFVSWHDGANGGDGYYGGARERRVIDKSSYYGWDSTWSMTRTLQPSAVIFSDIGPDIRWVGNEEGFAGDTCWATYTPHGRDDDNNPANGDTKYWQATGGQRDGKYWMPAECDVSLRPGWFYHAQEDSQVKTPAALFNLYCKSVGRGADLDLGLSPDPYGRLSSHDVAVLKEFGQLLRRTFSANLAEGAALSASNVRGGDTTAFGAKHLLDEDRYTYWATDDSVRTPTLTLQLRGKKTFDIVRLRENVKLGQRIDGYAIDAFVDNVWKQIAAGSSIGVNRLIRLPVAITTASLRLRVTSSPVCIALSDFALFAIPLDADQIETLTKPERSAAGQALSTWTASCLAMGTPSASIDLDKVTTIIGFTYLPDSQKGKPLVDKYRFETSTDGKTFSLAAEGEFANIHANPILQTVRLPTAVKAQFVRFTAVHILDGEQTTATLAVLSE